MKPKNLLTDRLLVALAPLLLAGCAAPVEACSVTPLKRYAELCASTLACAHAKSGDAAAISGYLGRGDAFDQAIGEFSLAYADRNELDHAALVAAVKAGYVKALVEEKL